MERLQAELLAAREKIIELENIIKVMKEGARAFLVFLGSLVFLEQLVFPRVTSL